MPASLDRHAGSFARKQLAALALIALANWLFYAEEPGWTLGLFALAWTIAVAVVGTARRPAAARAVALAAAAGFALVMIDDPNPLAAWLFLLAIGSAGLLARCRFDDALTWGLRLVGLALIGTVSVPRDAALIARRRPARGGIRSVAAVLALPLLGGALFLALFASANPLIEAAFARIEIPALGPSILHLILWLVVLVLVWPSLRPRAPRMFLPNTDSRAVFDLPVATLTMSLVTFNAIFLVQNISDIVFLWSGARLPAGIAMVDYVHRGAYSLIVTALLAGLFVLIALRPAGAAARSPLVRRLVVLWVLQNLLLVASSVLRTLDYIAASMLTVLRVSALAWMALVATGLVLICWRMLAARSARWLINTNAVAATVVLGLASVIDLGAVAATWNVAHARAIDRVDLCYLDRLGASALLPLIALDRRAVGTPQARQVRSLRDQTLVEVRTQQRDWHAWSWRNARRLARAEAMIGPAAATMAEPPRESCGGEPPTAALTQTPNR